MSARPARRTRQRPLTPGERADAILAAIPEPEMDALASALARLLISAKRNTDGPRRTIGPTTTNARLSTAEMRRPH